MFVRKSAQYYERLDKDFSIEKKTRSGKEKTLPHIHDQYELLLCLSDNMQCDIDTGSGVKKYSISKNTVLLFNNMDQHHFYPARPEGENVRYVAYFDPAYVDSIAGDQISLLECFLYRPFPDPQILHVTEDTACELKRMLDKIIRIREMPQELVYGKELYLRLLLAELLLVANGLYRTEHQISYRMVGSRYRSVYGIISFIHTHYDEPLSLDSLAARFFMNKFYLCEIFKKVTGLTLSQYIINCRLIKAKELLRSGHSVEDTCAMVGFNNMSHFSRTFKNKVGVNPKKYQQEMQEK